MTAKPRLLFISPRFLFPMNEGGKIRTANTLRNLKGGTFEIILASPAPAGIGAFAADINAVCDRFVSWPARRPATPERVLALAAAIPVGVATDRSAAGRAVIAGAIAEWQPGLIVADFPHATVLLPDRTEAALVMFTHNVEAEIFERHAGQASGIKALVWRDQARKMRRFEGDALRRYDSVIAVSARDAEALKRRYGLQRVEAIDTGVDLEFFRLMPPPARQRADTVVFTGVMDSPANIDGIGFLMDDIWPLVARARPDARALVVGRNPAASLIATARSRGLPWSFTGSVADIRPHVGEGDVSVIPLRIGSGTRIKAFEAMAMGRPVVATEVGIEGLDIEPGRHFLQADDPAAFAEAIVRLLGDAALRQRIVDAARTRLEERFSWATIAQQFETICLGALRRRG
nr:glycosyltransferase family 4 protein [uncultured Rhodopila sp.]